MESISIKKGQQMNKTVRQSATFHASPGEVYELLMDSKKHSSFTNARAKISNKIGGKISAYNGYITGYNIELKPGKLIVQSWHAADWPEKHMSTAIFKFQKIKTGTNLIFTQKNVPSEQYDSIKQGWIDNYWQLMKEYCKNIK